MKRKNITFEVNDSNNKSDESDDGSVSTDEELQLAFARGELTDSLHALVPLRAVQRINNVNAMREKLKQIKTNHDWIETLECVTEAAPLTDQLAQQYGDVSLKLNRKGNVSGEEASDVAQHDFKREMLFYRHAQTAVIDGLSKLHKLSVATKRPNDYFAEMAKTDDHMRKVRETIVRKQSAMDMSEKAKKLREMRKYGKKIQQEVLINRQKEKKQMMDKLKKFKKGREENLDFLNNGPKSGAQKGEKVNHKLSKKQKYKDNKFGYGGQKKRSKYNTASSAADMSAFSRTKHGRPASNKSKKRPGKETRKRIKNRKR